MEPLPSYSNFQNGWEASRVVFVSMLGYGPRGEVRAIGVVGGVPGGASKYYAAKCIDMGALGPDDIHVLRRACELTRQAEPFPLLPLFYGTFRVAMGMSLEQAIVDRRATPLGAP
eukprot:Sspe_Gene.100721::Locus_75386_Transcript_1_4_Confidence_0.667_Length_416::g.100721::m.100721